MIKPSDVTIIIPHLGITKEAEFALEECRVSLVESGGFDIIIATNGFQKDGSLSYGPKISSLFGLDNNEAPYIEDRALISEEPIAVGPTSRFRRIHLWEQGQNKAVNAAVATTNTPWIFVTNDDMIYPPGWFEKLTLGIPDEIMCISPQLVEPRPGAPTFVVRPFGGAGGDFDKDKFLNYAANEHISIGIRPGFNLPFLIRRDLWDTIGGYDINYDPWGSNGDSDLEYKIKLAGVQPYQSTFSPVYHFSQTSGTFNPDNRSYWEKNFAYFQEKWGFPRTDDGIWEATFLMPKGPERKFFPDWEGKYGSVS